MTIQCIHCELFVVGSTDAHFTVQALDINPYPVETGHTIVVTATVKAGNFIDDVVLPDSLSSLHSYENTKWHFDIENRCGVHENGLMPQCETKVPHQS